MEKIIAMVLAGGRGKRMDILCYGRSKPLLPFVGNWRVIDFSLSNCVHSGIGNIAAMIDYQRQHTAEYLKEWFMVNTGGNGLHILEPKSGSYKGTSDAIYQNLEYLRDCDPEAVLVLAGDHVYKMDYCKMLAFHQEMQADVTIGVITVPIQEAHRYGIVTTNAEGRIIDFVEKPYRLTSTLASMGIYVFNTKVLAEYLIEDGTQQDSAHDFGYTLIPRMVGRNRVFAYKFDGYWRDIGNLEAYYESNMELLKPQPSLNLNDGWAILTKESTSTLPTISNTDRVKQSIISPSCDIRGKVENSILSPGVIVEERAVVRNSIIMANTVIGGHSVVYRCILDEEVNIGKFCYIGFGDHHNLSLLDITVLGKGTRVATGTAVGRNIKVSPGTKLLSSVLRQKNG